MEYSDDGDLYQKIVSHQKNETQFEEDCIWKTLIHITIGLKKLHGLNILHRDLKVIMPSCRVPTSSSARTGPPSLEI